MRNPNIYRQEVATRRPLLHMCVGFVVIGWGLIGASASYAQDDKGVNNLSELVLQWRQAIATGELLALLPLYAKPDQDKVAEAFAWVQAGQVQLPLAVEMVNGRWVMRSHGLQLPQGVLASMTKTEPEALPEPSRSAVGQMQTYAVSLADQNFRKVLKRWTTTSGWMFEPEHWSVNRDIPVSGNDSVLTDFKTAVRRLLKSTLLTELPVQPCFYANKVLRVIPASELCARTDN